MEYKFILVSSSIRRIELLRKLGLKFLIISPKTTEIYHLNKDPCHIAILNALRKMNSIERKEMDNAILIAADTLIVVDNEIIGKPKNVDDAKNILKKLSGKWHHVYTGLVVKVKGRVYTDCCITKVKFKELTEKEIDFYVETGEPLDAAGAYKIQGLASIFIENIQGPYDNVVGLPLNRLYVLLSKAGIDLIDVLKKSGS